MSTATARFEHVYLRLGVGDLLLERLEADRSALVVPSDQVEDARQEWSQVATE